MKTSNNNKYKNIVLIGGRTGMSKHKIQYKIELHIEAIITFNNSLTEAYLHKLSYNLNKTKKIKLLTIKPLNK